MSAAREIIHTLLANPQGATLTSVFVSTDDEVLRQDFSNALGESVNVSFGGPLTISAPTQTSGSGNLDAVILSNVLQDWNLTNRKHHLGDLLKNVLTSLTTKGSLVIRENLANLPSSTIPDLTKFLDVYIAQDAAGNPLTFDFYVMRQVEASLYAEQNHLDVYWILTKAPQVQKYEEQLATFRDFLDKTQYTEDNVKSYEWIFGENFISPGGIDENRRVLANFGGLRPGGRMLDIGVGIGGGARQAAREFGLHVLGLDLSTHMIVHAFERNQRDKDARVQYAICDAVVYNFGNNEFDYVFSRDCVQHIKEQDVLFQKIYQGLKPGGRLLITRYGKGLGELKPKFLDYVAQRHYYLHNLEELAGFATRAGFVNVRTQNLTPRFKEILYAERDHAVTNKAEFVSLFSQDLYDHLLEGWENKLGYIADDNHNWHLIYAEKPKDATSNGKSSA